MNKRCVYDLETMQNLFTACFLDIDTGSKKSFVLFDNRDVYYDFLKFLYSCKDNNYTFVGFNNVYFDAQIIEFIFDNHKHWSELTIEGIVSTIYSHVQWITSLEDNVKYSSLKPEWKLSIPQIDLYLINHYNNKNKRTSLKWIEFTMKMKSIEEMPIHHSDTIQLCQINEILSYNWNDVEATYQFYLKNLEAIQLRYNFKEKYKLNCINWNDVKLGSDLLLHLYCEKTNKDKQIVRKQGTPRPLIRVSDIIFPYIKFDIEEFQRVLDKFKTIEIANTKSEFEFKTKYKGIEYFYGFGGIHGCITSGVYSEDSQWMIIDGDVGSLYPSIAIQNKLFPEHLGQEFGDIYDKEIVQVRLDEKAKGKRGDRDLIAAYKLAANGTYGKSNESYSWLYDPQYTMATTINGQLLITMWLELLYQIPEILILQVNTDGITVKIKREYKDLYYQLSDTFSKLTNFSLEFVEYKKMVILTVNDYLAVKSNGECKFKGDFEIEKELHKNNSQTIIPMTLKEYFVNNIPYKDYITNENHIIYNFCKGVKQKSDFNLNLHYVVKGEHKIDKGQRVTRYYISKNGGNLLKEYNDGRQVSVEAGWKCSLLNRIEDVEAKNYDIDYTYYFQEVEKIIHQIEGNKNQLTLF